MVNSTAITKDKTDNVTDPLRVCGLLVETTSVQLLDQSMDLIPTVASIATSLEVLLHVQPPRLALELDGNGEAQRFPEVCPDR